VRLPHLYSLALPNKLLSDVRLAALLNIPITAQTLITVLTRTRDVDMTVRRLVYGSVFLAHADLPDDAMPGAAHPRALTIAQREQIVRNGLGDREPAVRAAAGKLIGAWVDAVSVGTKKGLVLEDLLAFLGTFDLRESAVVEDALLSVFVTRVDVFDALEFDGAHLFSLVSLSHSICTVLMVLCEKKIQYRGVLAWIDAGKSVPRTRVCRPLRFDEGERAPRKGAPRRHSSCIPYPGRI
jgi:condensin complex subunit 3